MSHDSGAPGAPTRVLVSGWLRPDGAEALARYQEAAGAVMSRHGGVAALKARPTEALVGDAADLVVLLDFPTAASARAAFEDPAYAKSIPWREAAFSRLDVVDLGAGT